MRIQILLLRGINVGGHAKLPMAELRGILEGLGAHDVQTYIQSGNAIFRGSLDAGAISGAIEAAKGFCPQVILLDAVEFEQIARANPLPDADGKVLHIWFAATPADFDFTKAETLRKDSERIEVTGHAIYLYAPDGIGRSKLAAMVEKLAGVPCTARNWNTVSRLRDMASEYE